MQLVDKGDIVGELELSYAMRRQAMSTPDLLNGADRNTHDLGHVPNRPMGRFWRCFMECFLDQLGDNRL